jgi:hypothetical protein
MRPSASAALALALALTLGLAEALAASKLLEKAHLYSPHGTPPQPQPRSLSLSPPTLSPHAIVLQVPLCTSSAYGPSPGEFGATFET